MSNNRPPAKRAFLFVMTFKVQRKRETFDVHTARTIMMERGQSKFDILGDLITEMTQTYKADRLVVTSFFCELDKADWPETGSACRYRNLFDKD